jgi:very-short-patch-repair endonuclease
VRIIPQHPIKVNRRTTLFLDYYVPSMNMAFEADGIQHYKQNRFFHKNDLDFLGQQINDRDKESWCHENGVRLVRFRYDEKVDLTTLHGKISQEQNPRDP